MPTPQATFFSQANGVINSVLHNIRVNPSRVDWFITSPMEDDDSPYEELMDVDVQLELIRERLSRLEVGTFKNVTRVSLVTGLNQSVADAEEANRKIIDLCQLPLQATGLHDLSFQFNRRGQFGDGTTLINRLGKVSAEMLSKMAMQVAQDNGANGQFMTTGEVYHSVSVMLDFNTVPTGDAILDATQLAIFADLIEETKRAATDPSGNFFAAKE